MDFAMYTEKGNEIATRIFDLAKSSDLSWPETYRLMTTVASSNPDEAGELMDTAVREIMYSRCGFTTAFYI